MQGELGDELKSLFRDSQATDWDTIAGYEVHAIEATPQERRAAETLADRGVLKAQQKEPVRYGHQYSWWVRLVQRGTSWVAPEDLERIGTATTDTQVAAQPVKDLVVRNPRPKVITADSRYRDQHFLGAFAALENTFALVRLQNNQNLSQAAVPKPPGTKGAPRQHGADFQLKAIEREPDALEEFPLGQQKVRVRVWHKLHFKRLAKVVGSVVCVEFLKEDGSPRYKRPLWLFWTGPQDVAPQDLCRMYLWRFAIEPLFRFLKQPRGLHSHRSSHLESLQRWRWIVALAYWQLLLRRDTVQPNRPAWHPHQKDGQVKPLTPAQVQRSAQVFLWQSGTPAANPRPAGKGPGRQNGYRPAPRKRFDIVFKTKKVQHQPKTC